MKKKFIILGIMFIMIFGAVVLGVYCISKFDSDKPDGTLNGLPVYYTHNVYAFDMSTPEKAYGVGKYVFIAKVNDILRTEYISLDNNKEFEKKSDQDYDPVTVYSVSVIQNIKGGLITSEAIEIRQSGGKSKDGKSYIFDADSSYLNVENYYLFMLLVNEDGTLSATNPAGNIDLGNDLNLIKNVLNGTVVSFKKSAQESIKENKKIETIKKYVISPEKAVEPDLSGFIDQSNISDLNNVSKYDGNYANNN